MNPIECFGTFLENGYIDIPEEVKKKILEEQYSKILVTIRKEKQKEVYINAIHSLNGLLSDLSESEKRDFDSALNNRVDFKRNIDNI
jgi:hypothetical protein